MKVLTKNVVVFFYCKRHNQEKCDADIEELFEESDPRWVCGKCGEPMTIKKECLIKN